MPTDNTADSSLDERIVPCTPRGYVRLLWVLSEHPELVEDAETVVAELRQTIRRMAGSE